MRDWKGLEARYRRDPAPRQLGNLASDLARIAFFAKEEKYQQLADEVLEEGEYFAEWAAGEVTLQIQAVLREVQLSLAMTRLRLASVWAEPSRRQAVAKEMEAWSFRLLEASGLLKG